MATTKICAMSKTPVRRVPCSDVVFRSVLQSSEPVNEMICFEALSGAARLRDQWSANFAIGSDPAKGNVGARAGVRYGW